MLSTQDSRPERKLTVLFIAVGGSFAFVASIFGALKLAQMSGITTPINISLFLDHPFLQIFGFISEFVCGVAYSIIPLFSTTRLSNPRLGYVPFSLITIGNALGIAAVVAGSSYYSSLFQIFSFLILVASVFFCYQMIGVLRRKSSKVLAEARPFFLMAAISFFLISTVFFVDTTFPEFLGRIGEDLFSPGFLYLGLVGFVGSMIFGVELRTVVFRMTNYRKSLARVAAAVQAFSIVLSFLSILEGFGWLLSVASIGFLVSAISFAISIRIFEPRRTTRLLFPMTEGRANVASHTAISDYSDACILSSMIWLLFSCILGVVWLVFGSEDLLVRDSFIHSVAIGFIGSAVIGYGPVLLPGVLVGKAPKKNLSFLPLLFLNVGMIVRNGGNFYSVWFHAASATTGLSSLPMWESLSGVLVITAMILLMNNMHFRRTVATATTSVS
jgi:hypothetical protein